MKATVVMGFPLRRECHFVIFLVPTAVDMDLTASNTASCSLEGCHLQWQLDLLMSISKYLNFVTFSVDVVFHSINTLAGLLRINTTPYGVQAPDSEPPSHFKRVAVFIHALLYSQRHQ